MTTLIAVHLICSQLLSPDKSYYYLTIESTNTKDKKMRYRIAGNTLQETVIETKGGQKGQWYRMTLMEPRSNAACTKTTASRKFLNFLWLFPGQLSTSRDASNLQNHQGDLAVSWAGVSDNLPGWEYPNSPAACYSIPPFGIVSLRVWRYREWNGGEPSRVEPVMIQGRFP